MQTVSFSSCYPPNSLVNCFIFRFTFIVVFPENTKRRAFLSPPFFHFISPRRCQFHHEQNGSIFCLGDAFQRYACTPCCFAANCTPIKCKPYARPRVSMCDEKKQLGTCCVSLSSYRVEIICAFSFHSWCNAPAREQHAACQCRERCHRYKAEAAYNRVNHFGRHILIV